jgi:hypothetical protein
MLDEVVTAVTAKSAITPCSRVNVISVHKVPRIYIYKNGCVCVCVCVFVYPSITLEHLERFQPNSVHILLYIYV